ncbi:MAG TPA: transglutaminase family protein, partial [Polyangiaceae bacterium]|nr:transglutaminase family protein [Polyangiaceae bacterium]
SHPLSDPQGGSARFERLQPGRLLLVRQGAIVADVPPPGTGSMPPPSLSSRWLQLRPDPAPVRTFEIRHLTVYTYSQPVQRSTHVFRVEPLDDRLQRLERFDLSVSVDGKVRAYDDVFGNRARKMDINQPFTELRVDARSRVTVFDTHPFETRLQQRRGGIPLVWMPWQREILAPYLLPPELPEPMLRELTDYAMSFVERNDFDVLDTLFDLNTTIFREYRYEQGSTNLATTAFDVYENRRGVCQDFANLFICLSRLLGIPARYACGYIGGVQPANQAQAAASHAWMQVYLPELGWKGLDPTNGIVTQTEHVRVAVGRNYVDASPTAGTLFEGGGMETLWVEVSVEPG